MSYHGRSLLACFLVLSCSLGFAQSTKTSVPQPNDDLYLSEEFGICTFAYGKDRRRYVQPYVDCSSGDEAFWLIPQEDSKWAILVSPADEATRTEEEARTQILKVSIKVDDNDLHEFSMIWSTKMNMALDSLEFTEVLPLLDELRGGSVLTVSRSGEDIEFDINQANRVFADLVLEQMVALNKIEKAEGQ